MSNELAMLKRLQPFMQKSMVYFELFKAESERLHAREDAVEDLRGQLDVNTATWGLDLYEKELGYIGMGTYAERRSLIKSKWRGLGKFDAALIKVVAKAYQNGLVEPEFSASVINVKYTDIGGVPSNFLAFEAVLEELKPAHLALTFEFLYAMYSELTTYTHGHLAGYTHSQITNMEVTS